MKELGKIAAEIADTGLDSHGLALFTQIGGMSPEAAKDLCENAMVDVMGRKVHAYNLRKILATSLMLSY